MLSVGVKYSVRDLLFDVNNYAWPANYWYASQIRYMMSALSLASARFSKLWIQLVNDLSDGDLCKISLISIYSFFLIFNNDFIIYIDFTHITATTTTSDDVTNEVT